MIDWRQNELFKFWSYTILANIWGVFALSQPWTLLGFAGIVFMGFNIMLAILAYLNIKYRHGGF